jgi:hypothetical protein
MRYSGLEGSVFKPARGVAEDGSVMMHLGVLGENTSAPRLAATMACLKNGRMLYSSRMPREENHMAIRHQNNERGVEVNNVCSPTKSHLQHQPLR